MTVDGSHAPSFVSQGEASGIAPGQLLCSEPWYPCWNPATRYRLMESGRVSLRCDECASPNAPRLPFAARYKRNAVALPLATADAHCCQYRRDNGDRCALKAAHASEHFYREDGQRWRGAGIESVTSAPREAQ
jgi:hypothetical protein